MLEQIQKLMSTTSLAELRQLKLLLNSEIIRKERQKIIAAKLWAAGAGIIRTNEEQSLMM